MKRPDWNNGAGMLLLLACWREEGRISALDLAFARFIADLVPGCPPMALLAVAVVSGQLSRGHVCLDLAALTADPEGFLAADHSLDAPSPSEVFQALCRSELARDSRCTEEPGPSRASSLLQQIRQSLTSVPEAVRVAHGSDEGAEDGRPLVLVKLAGRERLYLARYWRAERQVAAQIRRRLAQATPVPGDLGMALGRLFPQTEEGTDWQKVACALALRRTLTLITGGPGTGKTTTVIRLLALLQGPALAAGRALRIRLAAPTGKAAARLTASISGQISQLPVADALRAALPAEVGTLHRLLGTRPDSRRFVHHAGRPLALDVLVVDEASMIDLELMASVLDALPEGARLILLGDKDQLASVEAGAVLGDLCFEAESGHYTAETLDWLAAQAGERPVALALRPGDSVRHALAQQTVMLRRSRRFEADSAIGRFALAVNRGDGPGCRTLLAGAKGGGELAACSLADEAAFQRLILEGRGEGVGYGACLRQLKESRPAADGGEEAWQRWAANLLAAYAGFQLLTALRDGPWGVAGLNRRIVGILQGAGLLAAESRGESAWDGCWYEGRPVLVTRNDYSLGVMNGDLGLCLALGDGRLRVAFPHGERPGRVRFLHPSRLGQVQTAFALTVHKAQGSEFAHCALALPDTLNAVLSRELVYTAVTRARQHFTLLEHPGGVLEAAVARRVARDSGLKSLLWTQPEEGT